MRSSMKGCIGHSMEGRDHQGICVIPIADNCSTGLLSPSDNREGILDDD